MIYLETRTQQDGFGHKIYITRFRISAWVRPTLLWGLGTVVVGLAFVFLGIVAS
jgi:hypothetical protein